jgi:hypothetical protein
MFALAEVIHPNSQVRLSIMAVAVEFWKMKLLLCMVCHLPRDQCTCSLYGRCHVTRIEVIPTTFTRHESLFADDEALSGYRHLTQITVHLELYHRISPTGNTHEVCQ